MTNHYEINLLEVFSKNSLLELKTLMGNLLMTETFNDSTSSRSKQIIKANMEFERIEVKDHSETFLSEVDPMFNKYPNAEAVVATTIIFNENENGELSYLVLSLGKDKAGKNGNLIELLNYQDHTISHTHIKDNPIISLLYEKLQNIAPYRDELDKALINGDLNELSVRDKSLRYRNYLIEIPNILTEELLKHLSDNESFNFSKSRKPKELLELQPIEVLTNPLINPLDLVEYRGKDFNYGYHSKHYTEEDLEIGNKPFKIKAYENKNGDPINFEMTVYTNEPLKPIHKHIRDAYYTIWEANPDATAIPLLAVVNEMCLKEGGTKFKSRDMFSKNMFAEIEHLRKVEQKVNITEIIADKGETDKSWRDYLDQGYGVEFSTWVIPASKVTMKGRNGQKIEVLRPNYPNIKDDPYYGYTQATDHIKRIPKEMRILPFKNDNLGENALLNKELYNRITDMPYGSKNKNKFYDLKQELNEKLKKIDEEAEHEKEEIKSHYKQEKLDLKTSNAFDKLTANEQKDKLNDLEKNKRKELRKIDKKFNKLKKDLIEPLQEKERALETRLLTINVDTVIEELELTNRRKNIVNLMRTFFNTYKDKGWIKDYRENLDGKTIRSFTISFF